MRVEATLDAVLIFDIQLLWEVIPQAIGLLGGLVAPLVTKGPPNSPFTAIAAKPLRSDAEVAY